MEFSEEVLLVGHDLALNDRLEAEPDKLDGQELVDGHHGLGGALPGP